MSCTGLTAPQGALQRKLSAWAHLRASIAISQLGKAAHSVRSHADHHAAIFNSHLQVADGSQYCKPDIEQSCYARFEQVAEGDVPTASVTEPPFAPYLRRPGREHLAKPAQRLDLCAEPQSCPTWLSGSHAVRRRCDPLPKKTLSQCRPVNSPSATARSHL